MISLNNAHWGFEDNLIKSEVLDILKKDINLTKFTESIKTIIKNKNYSCVDSNISDWDEEVQNIENQMTYTFLDQRTEDNEFDIEDNLDELSESENSTISDKYESEGEVEGYEEEKDKFCNENNVEGSSENFALWKKTFIKSKFPLRPKMKNDSIRKKKCKLKLAIIEFL